jgi:hypothetical protein
VAGWTTVEEFELTVRNFRGRDVEVEIHRAVGNAVDFESDAEFEAHDAATRKIRFTLKASNSRRIVFKVTTRHGDNAR